jgi:two-component system, OmpR family, sensor histidine kinase KdpD
MNYPFTRSLNLYFLALVSVAFITLAGKALEPFFDRISLALLYLLPVLVSAVRWGRGPSFLAAVFGVLAFDYFFVPPFFSFAVSDIRHLFIFVVYLLVALVTGTMAARLREEVRSATEREKRTLALYALSREIAAETDLAQAMKTLAATIAAAVQGESVILMPGQAGSDAMIEIAASPDQLILHDDKERAVAHWVLERGLPAGKGTDTLRGTDLVFFPISAEDRPLAVLALRVNPARQGLAPDEVRLIEAFANLGAVAIIRVQLAKEAEQAQWLAESEKLHTALLNSVSHDLRTPLASITGAATSLLSGEGVYDPKTRQDLLETIKEEAQRMNHYVANLLDMVRLEGGMLRLRKEWCDIEDILGVALKEVKDVLEGHPLRVDIPPDLPLVQVDFPLIEHVMINLLENAAKYSPPGSEISVAARSMEGEVRFMVADRGLPVPASERERVFNKFHRLRSAKQISGTGLGLSICKGIIDAHGGAIWVEGHEGGNRFIFSLPVTGQPLRESDKEGGADNGS